MHRYFVFLSIGLLLSINVFSNEYASNELLHLLNQDPSLLLDPENRIDPPAAPILPQAEPERELQSEEINVEAVKEVDTQPEVEKAIEKGESPKEVEPVKVVDTQPEEKKSIEKAELPKEVETEPEKAEPEKAEVVEAESVKTESATVAEVIQPEPKPTPVEVQGLPEPSIPSQLVALPGMNDLSVILADKEFFPSIIKIRQSEKVRLLFTSTSSKPGALVFMKPQILRWPAAEQMSQRVYEQKEISSKKVTAIEFSAVPGTYQFYDALSGASGEIQVE